MRSRQDQLHAYQYSKQRVVAALVTHDPDPARSPLTRTGLTVLAGMLVAAIALGATFAYSAITGRSGARELRDEAVVLIEKETGAQYVYTKADDRLHPVLNYASGLLIAKSDKANAVTIRRSGLAKQQRRLKLQLGRPLGIPDAPTSLPRPGDLIRDPWQLCTQAASAGARPQSLLRVGGPGVTGGHLLARPAPATVAEAVLVADPGGSTYLIYANHKFLIRKPAAALAAFGWTGRRATPVTAAWINAMPAGADVQPPRIPGLRQRSKEFPKSIGQLYRTQELGSGVQWAVLRRDGVLPITEVQARLLDADPATRIGPPLTLSAAEFSSVLNNGPNPEPVAPDLLPATVPNLVDITRTVCATVTDASTGVTAVIVDPDLPADPVTPAAAAVAPAVQSAMADQISVPFGRGALVEAAPSPDAPAGSNVPTLITDAGLRHSISDREALVRLGYGTTFAPRMPAELVALIPPGPALGTREALQPRP